MTKDKEYSTFIETVTGPIFPSELGFCHSHEHLFIAPGVSEKINPALRIDNPEKTQDELRLFKNLGGKSIVDAQPIGCGRMATNLVNASQITNVNIIASTGFHKLIFYPFDHWIWDLDEDKLTDIFIFELEDGMYVKADFSYPKKCIRHKAGIIKTASDNEGITAPYRKLFRAAGRAAKVTGSPILSHTEMGKHAFDQIKLFTSEGLDFDQIILCHLDRDLKDLAYHKEVAQTGVYLELDTIGRVKYHSDLEEVRFIIKMIEWGFQDKILLGLDTTRNRLKSYGGSIGLEYIKNEFIPLLLSYGVTKEVIEKFTIINPSKAFAKRGVKNVSSIT